MFGDARMERNSEEEEGLPRGGGDCAQGPLLYLKKKNKKKTPQCSIWCLPNRMDKKSQRFHMAWVDFASPLLPICPVSAEWV